MATWRYKDVTVHVMNDRTRLKFICGVCDSVVAICDAGSDLQKVLDDVEHPCKSKPRLGALAEAE